MADSFELRTILASETVRIYRLIDATDESSNSDLVVIQVVVRQKRFEHVKSHVVVNAEDLIRTVNKAMNKEMDDG